MARRAGAVTAYRWGAFLLATVIWVRCFADARLEEFGWQFQYLDIWALSLSVVALACTVRLSMGWSRSRHAALVGTAAALNAVIVVVHLGPLIGDAAMAQSAPTPFGEPVGGADPAWKAAYLHAVGPLVQIADAALLLGAFRQIGGALLGVAAVGLAYAAWLELAVRPLNATHDGTGGLPYAALNALEAPGRLGVYAVVTVGGLLAVLLLWALQRALRGGAAGPLAAG